MKGDKLSLDNIPTKALFKELKKRQEIDFLVIDEEYILKIDRKEIDNNKKGCVN